VHVYIQEEEYEGYIISDTCRFTFGIHRHAGGEAARYRKWFPKLPIATLLYRLEDEQLYLLQEDDTDF
jgi:hypothetical protein